MELAAPLWIKGFIWLIKEIVWIADRERDPPFVLEPGGGYTGRPWDVGRMSELVWWWRDTESDRGGVESWQRGSWVMDHFPNLCLQSKAGGGAGTFLLNYQEGVPLNWSMPSTAFVLFLYSCWIVKWVFSSYCLYIVRFRITVFWPVND